MVARYLKLFVCLLLVGCARENDTTQASIPLVSGPQLLAVASDFKSGALVSIPLEGPNRYKAKELFPVSGDVVLRDLDGAMAIIDRLNGIVFRFFPGTIQRPVRRFREVGSNPQDYLSLGDGTALVTRLSARELLRIREADNSVLGTIDLGIFGFDREPPYMSALARDGDKAFVTLQRLKPLGKISDTSYYVPIDLTNFRPEPVFRTAYPNPATPFVAGPKDSWYVGLVGETYTDWKLDGGIERLCRKPVFSPCGVVATEAELGGDLLEFVFLDSDRVAALLLEPENEVVVFRLSTRKRIHQVVKGKNFRFKKLAAAHGKIFVGDGDRTAPSVRVFDAATYAEEAVIPMPMEPVQLFPALTTP